MSDEQNTSQIVESLNTNGFLGRINFDPRSDDGSDFPAWADDESSAAYHGTYRDCSPYPPLPTIDLVPSATSERGADELGLFTNEDQSIHLIAVGQISNHVSLRHRLQGRAHKFNTDSTLEIALHLYEDEGLPGLESLSGRFAVAIWDQDHRRLILACDPLGMKPLYYAHRNHRLYFATNLAPVRRMAQADTIDATSIDAYLTYGFVPRPRCMVRDIQRLRPGRCLVMEQGEFKVDVISPFQYPEHDDRPSIDAAAKSIQQSVTGAMEGESTRVWSDERLASQIVLAASKAKSLATDLTSIRRGIDTPLADITLQMELDEPIANLAPVMLTAACRSRNLGGKLLTAFGGDEILLIHSRYAAMRWMQLGDHLPEWVKQLLIRRFPSSALTSRGHSAPRRRWIQSMKAWSTRGARRHYRLLESWLEEERAEIYRDEFLQQLDSDPAGILTKAPIVGHGGNIAATVVRDLSITVPDRSLAWFDRIATSHGLQYSHPLLERDVIAAVLPLQLKDPWRWGQRRRSLAIRLGAPVTSRESHSPSDAEKLCGEDLRELIHDLLRPSAQISNYLSPSVVTTLLDAQRRRGGFSQQVISLLMLELCLRQL